MNKNFISLALLGIAGLTFYKNFIESPNTEEEDTQGGGSAGNVVNRDYSETNQHNPKKKKISSNNSSSVSVAGVPDDITKAAQIVSSHNSRRGKKTSFNYDSKSNTAEIIEDGKKFGTLDGNKKATTYTKAEIERRKKELFGSAKKKVSKKNNPLGFLGVA